MAVLVDYVCDECGRTNTRFASVPIAQTSDCGGCGASARRRFAFGGVLGVRPARSARQRLDQERAERQPMSHDARRQLTEHLHHSHGTEHHDTHSHGSGHHHHGSAHNDHHQ